MAVGADVLHRGCTHQTRDTRECFDPRPAVAHGACHQCVPGLTGRTGQAHNRAGLDDLDPSGTDGDHCAVETIIGAQQVASPAEQEKRGACCIGLTNRLDELKFGGRDDQ